jgi:alpha-tubulin suppressor-like RCC1 family protein
VLVSPRSPNALAAPPAVAVEIAVGGDVSCARVTDGTLRCWGANDANQLGGTTVLGDGVDSRSQPTPVPGLSGVTQIAVGFAHVCATLQDGTLRCWGSNDSGRLGNRGDPATAIPTPVPGLNGVAWAAAGAHTCARLIDSSVTCWGDYDVGAGDPRPAGSMTPVGILGLKRVVELADSTFLTCARLESGAVTCWRQVSPGRIPRGKVRADPEPVRVGGASSIAVTQGGGCAVVEGKVLCWGPVPQLFETSLDFRAVATVPNLAGAQQIALSNETACARMVAGSVVCTRPGDPGARTPVPGLAGVVQLAAGFDHFCALTRDGAVWCWGKNDKGQLGDASTSDRAVPVRAHL